MGWIYAVLFVFLLIALLLYFRVATHFNIIDKPNERSSHSRAVIRGGGIIFVLAIWCWYFLFGMQWHFFVAGVTLVAFVSFLDDILTLHPTLRFSAHLVSILFLFYELSLLHWPMALVLAAIVVCIGTLNAFNFMDGINGITGTYALVTVGSCLYINQSLLIFTSTDLLLVSLMAVLLFLFFNFRKKAWCFAGDVGSVTLAFIQVFILLQLMNETGDFGWALFFLVFGVDSVVTIAYRIKRNENIFRAHRTHLYQYLANELKQNHLSVSLAYAAAQLVINIFVIQYFQAFTPATIVFLLVYVAAFIYLRAKVARTIDVEQRSGQAIK
jgi:UDP-GlcNAc:undecaprenyl-phosphate/decaprenyl-phosphate GlcNAc-1-phosphate transferase